MRERQHPWNFDHIPPPPACNQSQSEKQIIANKGKDRKVYQTELRDPTSLLYSGSSIWILHTDLNKTDTFTPLSKPDCTVLLRGLVNGLSDQG